MIYLIDDKKLRQNNEFGWSAEMFDSYNNVIYPIYTRSNFEEKREEIFKDNNIVIYHESFLDKTLYAADAMILRNEIETYAINNKKFYIAIFSGSKNSRSLEENIAHLPVSYLYNNLEVFTKKYLNSDIKLEYLLFGDNPNIEKKLNDKLDAAIYEFENYSVLQGVSKTLYTRPKSKYLQNPIKGADDKILFNDVSDARLSRYVFDWLSEKSYDNIFIPLCFGSTLSDFNGLRLALHILTTDTINQFKNIFIYGVVDYAELVDNSYFDVLKAKNVKLFYLSKEEFGKIVEDTHENISLDEVIKSLRKIKLEIPKSYYDNHSITNEWAIYRWAKLTDLNNKNINIITDKLSSDIYFKFLRTIYPIYDNNKLSEQQLKFKYNGEPRILLIDDEAEKGWYEILFHIISDINGMKEFDYLGPELKLKSQDEIIEICVNRVKENKIDVVILDFRITEGDHNELNVNYITGYRILEKIKYDNPGVQVIVFSATNKVWNLLALQKAGADGFIVKESPENSFDQRFTAEVIKDFCKTMDYVFERIFLKDLYNKYKTVHSNLLVVDIIDENIKFNILINELRTQIKVLETGLAGIDMRRSTTLDIVFLAAFNFLELYKKYYLVMQKDYRYYIGFEKVELSRYYVQNNTDIKIDQKIFIPKKGGEEPSLFHSISAIFIDYFNISVNDRFIIQNLWRIKDDRNAYIHGSKKEFSVEEITIMIDLLLVATKYLKE